MISIPDLRRLPKGALRGLNIAFGAVMVLGQAPFHIWPLAILALIGLKRQLDIMIDDAEVSESHPSSLKISAFGTGFWFGLGYFVFGLYWIGSAFIVRGPAYIPLIIPMVGGLAVVLALFWALAGHLYVKWARKGSGNLIAFTVIFSVAELARGHALGGFPWNLPGYIFPAGGAVSQVAAIIGVYGLTVLVFFIAAGLAGLVPSRNQMIRNHYIGAGTAFVLLIGLYVGGHMRLSDANITYVENAHLRVVQVPFSQKDKFDPRTSTDIVNRFIDLSAEPGLDKVTHVVWPEGAVNGLALENQALMSAMGTTLVYNANGGTMTGDIPAPIWLLQALRGETHSRANGEIIKDYYNASAAVAFDRSGASRVLGYSDKTRLVPFGEFIPGGKWLEDKGVKVMSTSLASISAASQKDTITFPGLPPVSAQICYEVIFPGFTPHKTSVAPEWILNQSNDAWFGKGFGPYQHFNQARYRAIEEGLPLVRAASNGVSGLVGPYGRSLHIIGPSEAGALNINLPKPLKKHRALPPWIVFMLLIVIMFMRIGAKIVTEFSSTNEFKGK